MSIDWSQEQSIPNTWLGSTAQFTPTEAGYMVVAVAGTGTPTQFGIGWASASDGTSAAAATGGNFLCGSSGSGSIYANISGSGTLPVGANVSFTLAAYISSLNQVNPFIYFYWIPASGAGAGLQAGRDRLAALLEGMQATVVEVPVEV